MSVGRITSRLPFSIAARRAGDFCLELLQRKLAAEVAVTEGVDVGLLLERKRAFVGGWAPPVAPS
jgi:hypothetical protein